MRALAFLGRSGSGKTTLIESLLPRLKAAGLRVVVVKHAHHPNIELEPAGKDTWRFRKAGAMAVALVAPDQIFTLEPRRTDPTLDDVLARLPDADLAIVESWRSLALPYIEVVGADSGLPDPAPGAPCIARVRESAEAARPLGAFSRDDVAGIATFLAAWARES